MKLPTGKSTENKDRWAQAWRHIAHELEEWYDFTVLTIQEEVGFYVSQSEGQQAFISAWLAMEMIRAAKHSASQWAGG